METNQFDMTQMDRNHPRRVRITSNVMDGISLVDANWYRGTIRILYPGEDYDDVGDPMDMGLAFNLILQHLDWGIPLSDDGQTLQIYSRLFGRIMQSL